MTLPEPCSHSIIVCFTSNESQRLAKSLETKRVSRYRAWSPVPRYSSSLCSWSIVGFLIRRRNSAWDRSRWSGILCFISDTLKVIWCFVPFWAREKERDRKVQRYFKTQTTDHSFVRWTIKAWTNWNLDLPKSLPNINQIFERFWKTVLLEK